MTFEEFQNCRAELNAMAQEDERTFQKTVDSYEHNHRLKNGLAPWAITTLSGRIEAEDDAQILIASSGEIPYLLTLIGIAGWAIEEQTIEGFCGKDITISWTVTPNYAPEFELVIDDISKHFNCF